MMAEGEQLQDCERVGLRSGLTRREDRFLVFRYTDRKRIDLLARLSKGKLRVVDDRSAYLTVSSQSGGAMTADPDALFAAARSVLQAK